MECNIKTKILIVVLFGYIFFLFVVFFSNVVKLTIEYVIFDSETNGRCLMEEVMTSFVSSRGQA
jgi:hypothetical protein